jgi:hypothetical protein
LSVRFAPIVLTSLIAALLLADRTRYLVRFGSVYTDADQATLWYQADDVAHGRFREPCFYGQNYGPAIEAWLAVPLLWMRVPAWVALPIVSTALGLGPFVVLAIVAYRNGHRWAAPLVLLMPLALPVEYAVVSALPRGFVTGLAVAAPAIACWLFGRSRRAFFIASLFAVLALTSNPNCSIALLAAGAYALLTHWRSRAFYLWSVAGTAAALPAPLLIWLFYHLHPEMNPYQPKAPFRFTWQTLSDSLNRREFQLFFGHFFPGHQTGWLMLVVLPGMIVLLMLVARFKAAIALLLASASTFLALGIERIHTARHEVFYSGSRMFLAVPVLFALWLIWFEAGAGARLTRWRWMPPALRVALVLLLVTMASIRDTSKLRFPSPLVRNVIVPPVDTVSNLIAESRAAAEACREHHTSLVLVAQGRTCFTLAGPVLSNHAFETLCPPFERRTFRIAEEQPRVHTRVLVYGPRFYQTVLARQQFPGAITIRKDPELLLITLPAPGLSGMDIAKRIGITYRLNL